MSRYVIRSALYSVLNAALSAPVVDFGPSAEDASSIYPFVAIGEIVLGEGDTDTTDGFDADLRIHTWGNNGSKEIEDIQGQIYAALHRQPVTVSGFNSILLYRTQSDVMRASSGAYHGVCDYRWQLTKT